MSVGVKISMGIIKALVYTYEFFTYPIYSIFRKTLSYTPLNTANTNIDIKYDPEEKKLLALSIRKDDPSSPWRCIESMDALSTQAAPGCVTACDLWLRSVAIYGKSKACGTRRVESIGYESTASGKKFIKAVLGEYNWETFEEAEIRISRLSAGLHSLLGKDHKTPMAIYSETRSEWFYAMQSIFRLKSSVVTLYATLGEEALIHGLNETEVSVLFVSHELLDKVPSVFEKCPSIKYVIYFSNGIYYYQKNEFDRVPDIFKVGLKSCKDSLGDKVKDIIEIEMIGKSIIEKNPLSNVQGNKYRGVWMHPESNELDPDALAFIMYTSGSTGVPKGVEISHKNISAAVAGFVNRLPLLRGSIDIYVGYLPLAHVFELLCELTCCFMGVAIGYGNPQTLVDTSTRIKAGSCKGDLRQLKPTLFAFVPTVVERIAKAVYEKLNAQGDFAVQLFDFAFNYKKRRMQDGYPSFLVDRFVFRKTRSLLGGKLRYIISGGAPLSEDSQWFTNICLAPVIQGYGLTETTASCALMETGDLRCTITGAPLSSLEVKLRPWVEGGYYPTDQPNPRGEVLIGGDVVTRGYYKKPDLTAQDFIVDNDGKRWFCTGDIGLIHVDGSLSIIDRKKDLVKLQAGEYVSLARVELILAQNPFVETICIYADPRFNFVVGLISPKMKKLKDVAEELGCLPTSEEIKEEMKTSGEKEDVVTHILLCKSEKINSHVLSDIQKFGRTKKLQTFEIPQKIHLDPLGWTPETGLVTDAFKLKRFNIKARFQDALDKFYS